MFRIRRFGVIRTANIVAFLYVVIVVVLFVPITLIVAIVGSSTSFGGNAAGIAVLFFGLLIAIFYGVVGWVFTAVACLLYNFAAGLVGGIEIQLEAVQPPPPPMIWGAPQPVQTAPPPVSPYAAPGASQGVPPNEPPTAPPSAS